MQVQETKSVLGTDAEKRSTKLTVVRDCAAASPTTIDVLSINQMHGHAPVVVVVVVVEEVEEVEEESSSVW